MAAQRKASAALYRRAAKSMVGGVNSPVRAYKAVGGDPLFIARGKGPFVWDADRNRLIDYVCSWGALILGHADSGVTSAVSRALGRGTSFGASTEGEVLLADAVCSAVPSVEKVRFVNSGTEATMSALRLARAFTGRPALLKFDGCYHGHADPFLSEAGSGMATFGLPASAGVPPGAVSDTLTIPFNDSKAAEEAFGRNPGRIAAVMVEPVAGNMGVIPPERGFLERLRSLCSRNHTLLIFDEVITGFRVSHGGAQALYGVKPDLTCLGKIIGGGFPAAAYGGRKDVMEMVSPEGPVYQAGTLSGNPVAMAAGLATLKALNRGSYRQLEALSRSLTQGVEEEATSAGVDITVNRVGSMWGIFFGRNPVSSFAGAKATGHDLYPRFFWAMLKAGVYLPPSAFESNFVSLAHSEREVAATIEAARAAFRGLGPRARLVRRH